MTKYLEFALLKKSTVISRVKSNHNATIVIFALVMSAKILAKKKIKIITIIVIARIQAQRLIKHQAEAVQAVRNLKQILLIKQQ